MKRLRFTETQILSILKEAKAGMAVKDVCRKNGISSSTCYKWEAPYGGLDASNLKRMKGLESEVSQYKRMYAEPAHENYALKELVEKKLQGRWKDAWPPAFWSARASRSGGPARAFASLALLGIVHSNPAWKRTLWSSTSSMIW